MKPPSLLALSLFTLITTAQAARAGENGAIDFTVATVGSSPSSPSPSSSSPAPSSAPSSPASSPPPFPSSSAPPVLSFAPPTPQPAPPALSPAPSSRPASTAQADLFTGGSDSLVARTVGHAEGTRTPNGSKTPAYYGHVDPGNGVWNLGSFSYQHGAKSPEEADEKQLRRLQGQADVIRQKAQTQGMNLSLEEELNAIDLANQAPLAALDNPGYVERLKQAHDRGLTGSDAVLWARTQSYWDPRLNRWNAPGLGNVEGSISHDQNRRQTAIARALDVYEQQTLARRREDEPQDKVADKPPAEEVADQIIFQNLSPARSGDVAQASH